MDPDDLFTSPSHSSTTSMYLPTSVADATSDRRTVFEVIPFWEDGMDGGWFATVSTSIILLFGTFGNVMTIVILRRLRSGWSAMNVYLTALALSDTAMLYTGTLPVWTNKMFRYDLYSSHVVVCKAAVWVMNTTASLSAWLLVALTLQRAASVVSPYRVSLLCTRRRSVVVIVVISVVCSLLYSHTVFGYKLVAVPLEELENGRSWAGSEAGSGSGAEPNATLPPTAGPQLVYLCTFGDALYQEFSVSVWIRVDMFIYSVLPCALLISSNAVLGWKLAASIKEAQELKSVSGGAAGTGTGAGAADANNNNSSDRRRKAAASSTTVTIIIISSVFVVLTLPLMVYNSWFQEYAVEESGKARALYDFVYEVFFLGGLSNYAWNFYLYCLTGSRFRGEFLDIMFRRRRRHRPVTLRVTYITAGSQMTSSGVQKENSYSQDDF